MSRFLTPPPTLLFSAVTSRDLPSGDQDVGSTDRPPCRGRIPAGPPPPSPASAMMPVAALEYVTGEPLGDKIGERPPLEVRRRRVPRSRSTIQMWGGPPPPVVTARRESGDRRGTPY